MQDFIRQLARDYNSFSELVALCYNKQRKGECVDTPLDWNRGSLNRIEVYLEELAQKNGATLIWECTEHEFGYDDWKRTLEYRTVSVSFD